MAAPRKSSNASQLGKPQLVLLMTVPTQRRTAGAACPRPQTLLLDVLEVAATLLGRLLFA
jgi:hypothetical protein